jgi:hypothetical protein
MGDKGNAGIFLWALNGICQRSTISKQKETVMHRFGDATIPAAIATAAAGVGVSAATTRRSAQA